MENLSSAQMQIVGLVIAVLPWIIQLVRKLLAHLGFDLGADGIRTLVLIMAAGLFAVFSTPIFPSFPGWDFSLLLAWGTEMYILVNGVIAGSHFLYEYIYRKLFERNGGDGALAGDSIRALAASN